MSALDDDTRAPEADHVLELAIGGMTCASCANRIERKLNKLEGVTATVNYATEKAKVSYAEGVSTDDLVAAARDALGGPAQGDAAPLSQWTPATTPERPRPPIHPGPPASPVILGPPAAPIPVPPQPPRAPMQITDVDAPGARWPSWPLSPLPQPWSLPSSVSSP